MPEQAYQPAGYCPQCGYAMDGGRCPECGSQVPPGRLAAVPPRLRRRRRVRQALVLALLVAVPYGAYRFWRDVNWLPWLPNAVLLWFADAEWERADREILQRCAAGGFSAAELQALFDGAYECRARYAQEIPAETAMPVFVNVLKRGVLRPEMTECTIIASRGTWHVSVGGQTPSVPADRCPAREVRFECPPLASGDYQIVVTGQLWQSTPVVPGAPPNLQWPVKLMLPLRVTDRGLADYVCLVCTQELEQAITHKVCAGALSSKRGYGPELRGAVMRVDVPIACEVYMRTGSDGEYDAIRDDDGLAWTVTVPAGFHWGYGSPLDFGDGTTEPQSIDIQLRPAPRMALVEGWNECFSGVIEWRDLPLRDDDHVFPLEHTSPPTHVYPCDEQ